MADEIPGLVVRMEATTARFEASLKKATQALNREAGAMDSRATKLNSKLSTVGVDFGKALTSEKLGSGIRAVGFQLETLARTGQVSAASLASGITGVVGSFGPLGLAAGVAIGILAPLFTAMFDGEAAAKEFAAALKEVSAASSDLKTAIAEQSKSVDDLTKKYFGAQEAILGMLEAQVSHKAEEAIKKSKAALDELRESVSRDIFATEIIRGPMLSPEKPISFGATALAFEFNMARDSAVELQTALIALNNASTLEDAVAALEKVRELMVAARTNGAQQLTESALEFSKQIVETEGPLREVLKQLENIRDKIVSATGRARELSGAFSDAARNAAAIKPFGTVISEVSAGVDIPTERFGAPEQFPIGAGDTPPPPAARPTGTRPAGRGAGFDLTREIDQLRAQTAALHDQIMAFDMLDSEKAAFLARAALVRKAEAEGIKLSDEKLALIDAEVAKLAEVTAVLEDKREAEQRAAETAAEALRAQEEYNREIAATVDGFIGAVQSAETFEDALRNVGLEALKVATMGLFRQGPLAGLLGGVFGGLFGGGGLSASGPVSFPAGVGGIGARASGGPVTAGSPYRVGEHGPEVFMPTVSGARASGGPVTAGSPYLVGEHGPEFFMPAVGGRVISASQTAQMQATAAAPARARTVVEPSINITVDARGAQAGVAEQIRAALTDYTRHLKPILRQATAEGR